MTGHTLHRVASEPRPERGAAPGVVSEASLVAELAAALDAVLDYYVDVDAGFHSNEEQNVVERAARGVERAARAVGPSGGGSP